MRKSTLYSLTAVLLLLFVNPVYSEVKLPAIISSNMVLQRNSTVVLWGWASANEKIYIRTSWLKDQANLEANKEGNWRIELKTTNSKAPQSIKIKSKNSDIKLQNVLFGEVWLCSGQSNMTQPVRGYVGQPTIGSNRAVIKSHNPNLRLFTVERTGSKSPLKDVEKYIAWQQASPESVIDFSAIGYFFGQQLQEILDVPVGIIHSSWGGSLVEAW
ncbi:MAG: sialate O-acetylesterase, partial [Saprospiraceae bacterium]